LAVSRLIVMSSEPTTVDKLRGLPWSIAGNSFNTVFVQFTYFGSAFILFLSELGLTKSQIGFLLSLFPFSGLIALFIAPWVARFGFKRTFLTFYGLRKVVTAFLLLTPWVFTLYGLQPALLYVSAIVAVFALCRATAETGVYPWIQEYVPNSVRGKYAATNNAATTVVGFMAVAIAGLIIGRSTGLTGFMWLIAVGVIFGLLAVWAFSFVPGGAPAQGDEAEALARRDLGGAVRDRNFVKYLGGIAILIIATTPMVSFLPLFMQEEVGLAAGNVVWLQTGTLFGGLVSGYLWGWAADRYGSRPVMLWGLVIKLFLPLAWLLMPRALPISLPVALAIALFQGFGDMGWGIGSARLLFVSVVPSARKGDYLALYYTWIGVVGGASQLLGGRILDLSEQLRGRLLIFPVDPYTPLFVAGLLLTAVSILLLRATASDTQVSVTRFAGLFLRGNPFLAVQSMIRYHMARDEHATVLMTERLGESKSPLTVDELLASVEDPRFHVRFEALVSIARLGSDERLIAALVKILHGPEPALSVLAAWALGRMGDERVAEPLREGLNSRYRSVQAHSSRALGALGDKTVIPTLRHRLAYESDYGLCVAYASALGQLRVAEATGEIIELLRESEDEASRMELALALARIVGDEHGFIRLLRQARLELGTATAQAVAGLKKKLERHYSAQTALTAATATAAAAKAADSLAHEDLPAGIVHLLDLIQALPQPGDSESHHLILAEAARQLAEGGARRVEYLLLAIHTLNYSLG
jgi:HEAT repeat protein/MFS family permease